MDFLQSVAAEVDALPLLEAVAAVLGVAYLLLAIRESIWCWLCAFVASVIFAWVFASSRLYMDAGLQLFYAAMAVYGWRVWLGGAQANTEAAVVRWPLRRHLVALVIVVAGSVLSGTLLSRMTEAAYPFVDSATTWGSLWATFLVARKVLENWWYWLVIDAVSIAIYLERGLEFAALLFVVYVVLIPFGIVSWTRSLHQAQRDDQSAVAIAS